MKRINFNPTAATAAKAEKKTIVQSRASKVEKETADDKALTVESPMKQAIVKKFVDMTKIAESEPPLQVVTLESPMDQIPEAKFVDTTKIPEK